jgi:hypothetical protein
VWDRQAAGEEFEYLKGTQAAFNALYAAGWHDELLWSARALVAAGKHREAIAYAGGAKGLNQPLGAIAVFCERVFLETGFGEEAYARYALAATYATANLATFKAILKKYPQIPRETVLRDLVASQPGHERKWFAAAKDAGFLELAIELANRSPSDPRTLTRAARDYAVKQPEFALAAGMTALQGLLLGGDTS